MNKTKFIEWTLYMERKLNKMTDQHAAIMSGTIQMIRETVETGQFDDMEAWEHE